MALFNPIRCVTWWLLCKCYKESQSLLLKVSQSQSLSIVYRTLAPLLCHRDAVAPCCQDQE